MGQTYIGSTFSIGTAAGVVADPSAATLASLKAETVVEVAKVISISELGDTSEDVTFDLLKGGRKTHVNGVKDIGEIAVSCEYDGGDAGQDRVRALSNTNTSIAVKVTDTDGHDQYFAGVVANYRVTERTASSYKGCMFAIRGQSAIFDD